MASAAAPQGRKPPKLSYPHLAHQDIIPTHADMPRLLQRAAGQGKDYNTVPLHSCQCPPCFESSLLGGCKAKCDLETCDLSNGICSGTTYSGVQCS